MNGHAHVRVVLVQNLSVGERGQLPSGLVLKERIEIEIAAAVAQLSEHMRRNDTTVRHAARCGEQARRSILPIAIQGGDHWCLVARRWVEALLLGQGLLIEGLQEVLGHHRTGNIGINMKSLASSEKDWLSGDDRPRAVQPAKRSPLPSSLSSRTPQSSGALP